MTHLEPKSITAPKQSLSERLRMLRILLVLVSFVVPTLCTVRVQYITEVHSTIQYVPYSIPYTAVLV